MSAVGLENTLPFTNGQIAVIAKLSHPTVITANAADTSMHRQYMDGCIETVRR